MKRFIRKKNRGEIMINFFLSLHIYSPIGLVKRRLIVLSKDVKTLLQMSPCKSQILNFHKYRQHFEFLCINLEYQKKKNCNTSRYFVSSLRRDHANLLCIVSVLKHGQDKQGLPAQKKEHFFLPFVLSYFLKVIQQWFLFFEEKK